MVDNESNDEGMPNLMHRCAPSEEANNWTTVEIPEIIYLEK